MDAVEHLGHSDAPHSHAEEVDLVRGRGRVRVRVRVRVRARARVRVSRGRRGPIWPLGGPPPAGTALRVRRQRRNRA